MRFFQNADQAPALEHPTSGSQDEPTHPSSYPAFLLLLGGTLKWTVDMVFTIPYVIVFVSFPDITVLSYIVVRTQVVLQKQAWKMASSI